MTDTQTQQPDSSTDIGSLAGGSSPFDGLDYKKSIADLTDLKRKQVREETGVMAKNDAESDRMLHNAEFFFRQEGMGPDSAPKPWDANKEHEKFESNPIEGLGSVGGIFAVIASAFTKAPMENAINGMAGAINSIKEGNEQGYQRAFDAFKTNVKLADQRFKMQHEMYSDALQLSSVDMAASDAKLRNAAVRFGDQHVLTLAEHGMVKEIYELIAARASANEQMVKSADALDEHRFSAQVYDLLTKDIPKGLPPAIEAGHKLAAWNKAHGIKEDTPTPEQAVAGRIINENPKATGEELSTLFRDAGVQVGRQPERDRIISERVYYEEQAIRDREGREPTAAESAKIRETASAMGRAGVGAAGGLPKNSSQLKIAEMQEIKDAAAKEGRTLSTSEAEDKWAEHQAKIKMETATITGNKADDLLRKRDLATDMIADSNKNIDFLQTHKWPAGVLGKVMRGEELVGNIAGTTDTERKDFYRRVHEMSMIAPQLLADQTGRPLKAMQDEVRSVVAGLEAGDTGPNTISAYRSLIERLEKRQADWNTRLTKSPAENAREGGAPSAPATEKSGKRPLWESAPIDPGPR